jgi:S1-C subfamily serine protease
MRRVRAATVLWTVAVLVAGCGDGIGETLHRLAHGSSASEAPTPAVSSDEVVAKARPSVVKVRGESESCQKITEGSGFVVAPNKVMTNAHVVAGAETFSSGTEGKTHEAQVVSYDPRADIAILDVPDLSAEPLEFARYTAGSGTHALVLGYPGASTFQASPVQIREVTELSGPDIYRVTTVTRQAYILTGSFPQSGSSGSALVDLYGQVLGVYFGAKTNDSTTGFAIAAAQVIPQLAKASAGVAADTGDCVV